MIGGILKFLLASVVALVIFSIASIAGVKHDIKKAEKLALEGEEQAEAAQELAAVTSPFPPYTGGVLDLQMDYEVQVSGEDIYIYILSNLPDGFDLSCELTNVEAVKQQLGYENISASALTAEQMAQINELTYNRKERNFVAAGVCSFLFQAPPQGQLDLTVTSPISKLQSQAIQDMLGEAGVNLQGAHVVYLEEVADKSINFSESFMLNY